MTIDLNTNAQKPVNSNVTSFSLAPNWGEIDLISQRMNGRLGAKAKEFVQAIETHFRAAHSPVFYAEKLNITKSYLRKICQQLLGFSPSQCIAARILQEACALLNDHDLTVQQVAERLGFEDAAYFNRFFKKHLGLPPNAYRKVALHF